MPKICFLGKLANISVLANKPTVYSGGVSRGRVQTLAVGDAVVVAVGFIGFVATIHTCEET